MSFYDSLTKKDINIQMDRKCNGLLVEIITEYIQLKQLHKDDETTDL